MGPRGYFILSRSNSRSHRYPSIHPRASSIASSLVSAETQQLLTSPSVSLYRTIHRFIIISIFEIKIYGDHLKSIIIRILHHAYFIIISSSLSHQRYITPLMMLITCMIPGTNTVQQKRIASRVSTRPNLTFPR